MAADLLMVKAVTDNLKVSHNETEAKDLNIININFRIIDFREVHFNRAENMIPQLDGTYSVSDSSDTNSHDYLDLASTNIIQYRTRGQKQRHIENEMAYANMHSAHIEYIKPNTKVKI